MKILGPKQWQKKILCSIKTNENCYLVKFKRNSDNRYRHPLAIYISLLGIRIISYIILAVHIFSGCSMNLWLVEKYQHSKKTTVSPTPRTNLSNGDNVLNTIPTKKPENEKTSD